MHVIPRVEYGPEGRCAVICSKQGVLPFEPVTPKWFAWAVKQNSFRFVGKGGRFTAHYEWRVPNGAWRAHRKIRNHTHIVRLAPNHELTLAVLERAAAALQARLSEQLAFFWGSKGLASLSLPTSATVVQVKERAESHFALHSERGGLPVLSAKEGEAYEEDRGTGAASA